MKTINRRRTLLRARHGSALLLAGALIVAGVAARSQADEPQTRAALQVPIAQLLDARLATQLATLRLRPPAAANSTDIAREDARRGTPRAKRPTTMPQGAQEKSS